MRTDTDRSAPMRASRAAVARAVSSAATASPLPRKTGVSRGSRLRGFRAIDTRHPRSRRHAERAAEERNQRIRFSVADLKRGAADALAANETLDGLHEAYLSPPRLEVDAEFAAKHALQRPHTHPCRPAEGRQGSLELAAFKHCQRNGTRTRIVRHSNASRECRGPLKFAQQDRAKRRVQRMPDAKAAERYHFEDQLSQKRSDVQHRARRPAIEQMT